MTTAPTATQRSTCRLPLRGCLRMGDLPLRLGRPVPSAKRIFGVSRFSKCYPVSSVSSVLRIRSNQRVRPDSGSGLGGRGACGRSGGGSAGGSGGQPTQRGADQGRVGGGPERG